MGGWLSFFWSSPQPSRILILGLGTPPPSRCAPHAGPDNAGKTTLLNRLKLGEVTHTVPTVGFNVESISYKNVSFFMWDVGGQEQIRLLWRHYYDQTEAVIWVIDSADRMRFAEAKEELHRVLAEEKLKSVPLLVFINKQDAPGAIAAAEAAEALGLNALAGRAVHVQPAVAPQGTGLNAGLDWLVGVLAQRRAGR